MASNICCCAKPDDSKKEATTTTTDENEATERSQPFNFKRFDIITDYSDHHYADTNMFGNNIGSDVLKRIMREWKILGRNLPDSIFVRAYEERIDLLRIVIIGPAGTPYHDGLFFFDLAFSSDYPVSPPMVYYHSYGLRLNPNLYADGYVCLSLINTWDGKEEERWNPAISTVLQILISIQALVLNERPYFNEPGLKEEEAAAEEAEIYSDAYNKEAYLFCCKMMLNLIQNPPYKFEGFVREYFRQRGERILAACKAYSDGRARVGCFNEKEYSSNTVHVSAIFKELMEKTYRDLYSAFIKNGALMDLC